MKRYDTIVIGGGASGLVTSATLKGNTLLIESNDRVGKKILATGNGRCNLTNEKISGDFYSNPHFFNQVYSVNQSIVSDYFKSVGLLLKSDNSGRVYPYSMQASTVLDVLRGDVKCDVQVSQKVLTIQKAGDGYRVVTDSGEYLAKYVVVATGGGKNSCLSQLLPLTDLSPALCPIKTDTTYVKGLDGVRAQCGVTLFKNGQTVYEEVGEVLFRTYGVSGVSIFNASAYIARDNVKKKTGNWTISLNFLKDTDTDEVKKIIDTRIKRGVSRDKLLLGIVANKIAECVLRRVDSISVPTIMDTLTNYTLSVKGLQGDIAQVTSGGVDLSSVGYDFQSKKHKGLFITGEALDMDGLCGGYNLHWAFMSGLVVSKNISYLL